MNTLAFGSLYIAPLDTQAGTRIITLGIMEWLKGRVSNLAVFFPLAQSYEDAQFLIDYFDLQHSAEEGVGFLADGARAMIARHRKEEMLEELIARFSELGDRFDFIVCLGMHDEHFSASLLGDDFNIQIANNLNVPLILSASARQKSTELVAEELALAHDAVREQGGNLAATFVGRVEEKNLQELRRKISRAKDRVPVYLMPEVEELDRPTVREIVDALGLEVLSGEEELGRSFQNTRIADMELEHFLERLSDGDMVVVPGDRSDILLGTLAANSAYGFPSIAALLLTGGVRPTKRMMELLKGVAQFRLPILAAQSDTYATTKRVDAVPARIKRYSERKIALAMGLFNRHVDLSELEARFALPSVQSMTPAMFKFRLFEQARAYRQKIVLPESSDERVLRAAEILLRRGVVELVLLGDAEQIGNRAASLAVDLSGAEIVDPATSPWLERFADRLYELRRHKGLEREDASEMVGDAVYFATMMVYEGYADGMVCGAIHPTNETIRPALQTIKTRPGTNIVSSIFFMCLPNRVLVYGDCAINKDPTAEELAQIAVASADTTMRFGITPKVAMLSYSTGTSGEGSDVEKVREATSIARQMRPELLIEGPLQYDAAIDQDVAKLKLPQSKVAGEATVFIFPDLNTGNNTYKAVQRSAGAIAIGPILQGLNKPVNDLSRGCLVEDIVNTVVITAIQAQVES